ncbi:winged helix DNA-binding protein [Ideonella sp. B7]|uniref:MarR family winged helix-turn-helix transcriptional regulator n=1 Tax=Ideonella benzenivorans TaxID=2831643 RepID=UPI001CEDC2D8|nr:MarR family transcriptional regulator [Ideonella benzenivorans]MCA6215151.1 winged helix DNA-binding protein [Ideonella benzenivorans]
MLDDPALMHLTTTLTRVARSYRAAADEVSNTFGLSHAMAWPAVMIGRMGENARLSALAEAVGLEPASLVRVIDQLVAAGVVVRHEDPHDRRAKVLSLTPLGQDQVARVEQALNGMRRQLLQGLSDADLQACLRVLLRLEAGVAELPKATPLTRP